MGSPRFEEDRIACDFAGFLSEPEGGGRPILNVPSRTQCKIESPGIFFTSAIVAEGVFIVEYT